MSYNAEVAKQPLTGEPYDILILQEREQRHLICDELPGYNIMPVEEYLELIDAYKKLVEEREAYTTCGEELDRADLCWFPIMDEHEDGFTGEDNDE